MQEIVDFVYKQLQASGANLSENQMHQIASGLTAEVLSEVATTIAAEATTVTAMQAIPPEQTK